MQDYAKKTVTIDPHPHLSRSHGCFRYLFSYFRADFLPFVFLFPFFFIFLIVASIHPCQHGPAMLRIIEALKECSSDLPRVDQYLFIFLKFIQSVVPTIEYDYTTGAQVRGR